MADPARSFAVVRVRGGARATDVDRAATEEPLEIRLHGRPFAVVMRTPGADRELAAGFLLAEQVLGSADDLGTIEYCTNRTTPQGAQRTLNPTPDDVASDDGPRVFLPSREASADRRTPGGGGPASGVENIVNVTLTDQSRVERAFGARRQVDVNASCGLCGRLTIESLMIDAAPIGAAWTMSAAIVAALPQRLRRAQAVFDETGGLHASGLFTAEGVLAELAEDVGRHNAVDKVVGRMLLREALPASDYALCVSGRTSFEIVQKALLAGIPIVAAVSAPSSLAIDLAERSGITLVGFVRGDSFNIYTHPHRIA